MVYVLSIMRKISLLYKDPDKMTIRLTIVLKADHSFVGVLCTSFYFCQYNTKSRWYAGLCVQTPPFIYVVVGDGLGDTDGLGDGDAAGVGVGDIVGVGVGVGLGAPIAALNMFFAVSRAVLKDVCAFFTAV
ncbi:MAG: hypothetical protein UX66_C0031G0005 [Parcubacteria group bacterium GW2011_GWF2_46_8]|nr:MAG: hypothetical protein UX66_C0031G0005 [Parcubacteria group bacterium GW2011_GWF2_46_8]